MRVEEWDKHWSENWERYGSKRRKDRLYALLKTLRRGKTCDLGIGNTFTYEEGDDITGVDISPVCIARCKELYPFGNWIVGDAAHTGLPDSEFDTVIASHILEHYHDQQPFIDEMKRIVKPDGQIIIVIPRSGKNRDHVCKRWTRAMIQERVASKITNGTFALRARNHWVVQGGK